MVYGPGIDPFVFLEHCLSGAYVNPTIVFSSCIMHAWSKALTFTREKVFMLDLSQNQTRTRHTTQN